MSKGSFILANEALVERPAWGQMLTMSRPAVGARNIVTMIVDLEPGAGHNFHYHAGQEEVIYVLDGAVQQWLEEEHRILHAGDSVLIGASVVHASFNTFLQPARLFVVVGPCIGESGYSATDVSDQPRWHALR